MKPIVLGNWKMHKSLEETLAALRQAEDLCGDVSGSVEVVIAPSVAWQAQAHEALTDASIQLCVQDARPESEGAFTGSVSFSQVAPYAEYALVGHSERRQAGASEALMAEQVRAAMAAGLRVVLCIGETREERERGDTERVIEAQLTSALFMDGALDATLDLSRLAIAYEPVWAISGGDASVQAADEVSVGPVFTYLRSLVDVPLLYGGSVNEENTAAIAEWSFVQGVLVGGASLDPDRFSQIVRSFSARAAS